MTVHSTIERQPRHDGWTPERQVRFLDCLAEKGNVRHACGRVGLSQQAAYVLRRRDAAFARGWAAALALARENSVQVLAERALDGVEDPIWYRGEHVGTRRKYDARLLLAHIARLDKLVDEEATWADAGRFDELLASIAGEPMPPIIADDRGLLPLDRESAGLRAGNEADFAVRYAEPGEGESSEEEECPDEDWDEDEEDDDYDEAAEEACIAAYRQARADGERGWDGWFENACHFVDRASGRLDEPPLSGLPGGSSLIAANETLSAGLLEKLAAVAEQAVRGESTSDGMLCTPSTYSTSALARALSGPPRGYDFRPRSPLGKGKG